MILSVVVLIVTASSAVQATFHRGTSLGFNLNFGSQCNGVNGHLLSLTTSFSQIKAIAQKSGNTAIVAKCNEAQKHLAQATSSFGVVAKTFSSNPWNARGSTQSTEVRYRLSLCGNILNWISIQAEVQSFKGYSPHVSSCQNTYVNCQKSCGQIWSWPTPPSKPTYVNKPKPSQAHGGYYRRSVVPAVEVCPPFEDSCPVSSGLDGEECLDLQNEVASCGGCVSKKEGENCLDIPGADGVGCLDGRCVVLSVLSGFSLSKEGRPVKV